MKELIKTYTILIQDLSSKYRNGFPLGYEGLYIFYKERDWDDFHFYHGSKLNEVKVIQPSVYYEQRGSISTTYHSDYYDRILCPMRKG